MFSSITDKSQLERAREIAEKVKPGTPNYLRALMALSFIKAQLNGDTSQSIERFMALKQMRLDFCVGLGGTTHCQSGHGHFGMAYLAWFNRQLFPWVAVKYIDGGLLENEAVDGPHVVKIL